MNPTFQTYPYHTNESHKLGIDYIGHATAVTVEWLNGVEILPLV